MSISDADLEILKPTPKPIKTELDLLGKYQSDLDYLKNGKMIIERHMAEEGIDDEVINKKMSKLNKSIERLEELIENYEKDLGEKISDYNNKKDSKKTDD